MASMTLRQTICAFRLGASAVIAAPAPQSAIQRIHRRQQCTVPTPSENIPAEDRPDWEIVLAGDGNNYKYMQLTDNNDCNGNVGCEIAETEVEGRSFSWSVGVSIDGWINGGFEVSEYEETGQVSNCQGEPQDVICVYWRAAYTDYTVDAHDLCGVEPEYQTVIQSPNSNGVGSTYLCGRNAQCQNRGFEFWNTRYALAYGGPPDGAPVGGPQRYPFEDDGSLGPA
ncbi:hypothetical protein LTR09_003939 [Extremus antarcticus]|uniref:Uncharacterized protein n=1 Tax=Extremus antarcticus TaxID=702011 RepID=A0AAJ0DRM7_9PEZI|nr:hypothetical protein LTR09_003939 [Extremus antarcticus]